MITFHKYVGALLLSFTILPTSYSADNSSHSWTRTNPGGGGAISMVGATKSGTLITASDLSGVYRSFDNGATWDALGASNGLIESHISSLGFHATDGNTFLIGTGRGIYKTKDAGNTIYQASLETVRAPDKSGKADGYIESIGMAFSDVNIGYLAHYEDWNPELTFMKTIDAGDTWKIIQTQGLPAQTNMTRILVDRKKSNIVYALTGKSRYRCSPASLYRSIDSGVHWQQMATDLGAILDFDLHPSDPNKFYVSTFKANLCDQDNNSEYSNGEDVNYENYIADGSVSFGSLYVTSNNGVSFTELKPKNDQDELVDGVTGMISVSTTNPNTIRVTNTIFPFDWNDNAGTWETNDEGQNWQHTGTFNDWEVGMSGTQYFSFIPSYHGLSKTLVKDIFNSDQSFGSFGQWAWGSFDGGKTLKNISTKNINGEWRSTGVENTIGHALDINDKNPNVIYMGGLDIGFWTSKNHGESWTRYQPSYNKYKRYSWDIGTPPLDLNYAIHGAGSNISTLLNDPERENVVWASFSREQYANQDQSALTGLFKSNQYGENFEKLNINTAINKPVRIYGLSLDINSPKNNRTLYVTMDGDVYKSINDGETWSMVLAKGISGSVKFTQVDKLDPQLVYAGGAGGLWRSEDAGATWSQIGGSFKTEMQGTLANMRNDFIPTDDEINDNNGEIIINHWEGIFDIKTDPKHSKRLYVTAFGKGKGLYRSDDAGITWKKLITDDHMRGIAIAPQDSNIVYATSSVNYYSGGTGNSLGIQVTTDGGDTWQDANQGMGWKYGGTIEVETGAKPNVWAWSPGTGVQYSPVPSLIDSDNDGLPDAWEIANGLDENNPLDALQDPDFDQLTNLQEYQYATNPHNRDTDGDGASDGIEIKAGTDPLDSTSTPQAKNIPSLSAWSTGILIFVLGLLGLFFNTQKSITQRKNTSM